MNLSHGTLFMSNASPSTDQWQHSGGKQSLISQSSPAIAKAWMCTIFSQKKVPTHTWKQGTLQINKHSLTFKPTSAGILLHSYNDERLQIGNGSERSFNVHRKDQRLVAKKTENKERKKKRNKRETAKKPTSSKKQSDLKQWDQALIEQCKASSKKRISFYCSLTKADSSMVAATDKHITLKSKNMTLPLPWSRLSSTDKAALSQALAHNDRSSTMKNALAAVYYKDSGELIKSNKYFAKAGDLQEQIKTTFE